MGLFLWLVLWASLGSFLCCLWERRKGHIQNKRSICPICFHELNAIDLLPILGFIIRKGRCAYCQNKIDKTSFYTEISFMIIGLIFYIYL